MQNFFSKWNNLLFKLASSRTKRLKKSTRLRVGRRLRLEPMEDRRMMATLTVNSLADAHINTDGVLTLREAVEVVQQGSTNGLDSTTIANQISGSLVSDNTIRFAHEREWRHE